MKRALVWFKTDLRLTDNETLIRAIEWADEIIPVFVIDGSQLHAQQYGFTKMGKFQYNFLLESLQNLQESLLDKGADLLVVKGDPEIEIPRIANHYNVQKVFAKKEIAPEEKQLMTSIEAVLWKNKIILEQFSTSVLYAATDLPFSIKDIPHVFTDFRKKVEKEAKVKQEFAAPQLIVSPNLPNSTELIRSEIKLLNISKDERTSYPYTGGETHAIHQLNYYLFESEGIKVYKETRNALFGKAFSSKFSAYLALGCISPRTIYHQVVNYENQMVKNESTYWLIFELLWRDFFRYSFKKNAQSYFKLNGESTSLNFPSQSDQGLIDSWINGETANNLVNAAMIELKTTGWMSNRMRQIVASYFIYELGQDWRIGAAYFESQLIDYDVSNNWGNWAYIAGVGNDPRSGRVFNLEKQEAQYDKEKVYQKLWGY